MWVWVCRPSLNTQKGGMKVIRLFPKPTQNLKLCSKVFQTINLNPVFFFRYKSKPKIQSSLVSTPQNTGASLVTSFNKQNHVNMSHCPSLSKNKHKNVDTLFLSEPNKVILFRQFSPFQGEFSCISVYTNHVLTQ